MASPQDPLLGEHSTNVNPQRRLTLPEDEPLLTWWRKSIRNLLSSRWGHYLVLLLVTIDVCCSFADFLIQLHVCELKQNHYRVDPGWGVTKHVLGVVSLVISCLFMVELMVAVFGFGLGYFSSTFHIFDSLVILVAFIIEVSLQGMVEEVGELVIVLRLWRVFQIIEELRSASEDTVELYEQDIERLREENVSLRQRLNLNFEGHGGVV